MNKKSLWKLILILAIPCIIGFMPAPAGLSELAWVLFGIYLAAIVGLVIKPFPEPVVLLIAVAASMVVVGNLSDGAFKTTAVLSGYSSGTTWLVFSAFTLSAAFVTTGLGKRIAYLLIGKIGNTTLGLGYVTVFLDLVLAPATPSNTARAGGIVLPIINSVAVALGSEPEKSPRRVGHYLMMSIYMVTKTTSYMFFTAMAGNILALKMINATADICPLAGLEPSRFGKLRVVWRILKPLLIGVSPAPKHGPQNAVLMIAPAPIKSATTPFLARSINTGCDDG